jgi:hypothetical protein
VSEVKTLIITCDVCGADMTKEKTPAATSTMEVTVNSATFEIKQAIGSISRLDDGKDYDICNKCRAGAFEAVKVQLIAQQVTEETKTEPAP